MKIIYQADDGRQFDTADECEMYERRTKVYRCMHAVDDMGKVLSPEDYDFVGLAIVVNLETKEAVAEFIRKGQETLNNTEGITSPGTYVWNFIDNGWQTESDFWDYWTKLIADAKIAFGI